MLSLFSLYTDSIRTNCLPSDSSAEPVRVCVEHAVESQFSRARAMFSFSQGSVVLGPYFYGGGHFFYLLQAECQFVASLVILLIIANRILSLNTSEYHI